ncbi:hypothetical protein NX059_009197 [Plenodomus lindquistii]|nr:hypothetical protein NX059_009197 [Plenodomus lindquistii]
MTRMDKQEPIAIVGAACRFAGDTTSLDSLWDLISKVKTGHCPVPSDRWNSKHWHHPSPDRKGAVVTEHGYFIQQDISQFDAPFFSMTAKEAAAMDPMKRLLLEVTYESIENAGIILDDLMNSRTGCYVGCMTNDYEMITLHDIYDSPHPAASGLSEAMTANRVSWFYGLKGPSLTIDTACSSSLYALHYACQSLRLGETNLSIVAGVNLIINPNTSHQLSAMHMLSPEGISHTFDDRANGYGRGDGIGSLIVKRLSDAIRDGDTVRAVIRGTGVNADGKTPSITQPSSDAQADLINQTYEDAGLDQADTEYFECHGTGTPVGDPIELTAISKTIGAARRAAGRSPLPIGSIKPTVGHTEGCAGLAGIFKAILLMEKGALAPTYGVEMVNPKLRLKDWHLTFPHGVVEWETPGVRRVSVNSFGFGGANAHVILDDAHHYLKERGLVGKHNTAILDSTLGNQTEREIDHTSCVSKRLFVLSSKDQTSAKRVSEELNTWLQKDAQGAHETGFLDNIAYTLGQRRTHLEHRTFAIASSLHELTDKLSKDLPVARRSQRHGSNLVMVFTGQGAQWPTMARELFDNPVFRRSINDSNSHLKALGCSWDAIEELTTTRNPNIDRPEYSQPLCTVVQIALVEVLRFWKILPTATIGHSSGEIAAAYAASLLTHHDAIKLAFVRGIASAAVTKPGAMLAAGVSQDEARNYLKKVPHGSAVVACINSPSNVTISGDVDAINQLETIISNDGKFARKLKVLTAYHSPHMSEVSGKYLAQIGDIFPTQPAETETRPVMYSSLTGSVVGSAKELDAQYWVNNMREPVQFSRGLLELLKHKRVASGGTRSVPVQWGGFLEIGPHAALQGPVKQIIDASNNRFAKSAPYASMLLRGKDAVETSLSAAGTLWAAGYKVDMNAINCHLTTRTATQMLCDMPTYPWNHSKSFWHESYSSRSYRFPPHARNDFLGMAEDLQNSHEPRWRNFLRVTENPWIEDHTITGTVLYPGAGMLVMAIEGAQRTSDPSRKLKGFRLSDVMFERGLVISLDESAPVETRISFQPHSTVAGSWIFRIFSTTRGSPLVEHCTGSIALVYEEEASEVEDTGADINWQKQLNHRKVLLNESNSITVDVNEFYQHLDTIGMQYGPTFRNTVSLTAVPPHQASYGTVVVPDTKSTMPEHHETPHIIHPATLDSIFHLVIASLDTGGSANEAVVPYSIGEMYIARDQPKDPGTLYSGFGRLVSQDGHEITSDLVVSDEQWSKPKVTIENFALRTVTSGDGVNATGLADSTATNNCAEITWIPDLSFLTSGKDLVSLLSSGTPIDICLDSVFLKSSNLTVLVTMFDDSESSMTVLTSLKTRKYRPKRIVAFATSESHYQVMRATLGEDTDTMLITCKWLPESELLQTLAPEANDLIIGLGVPNIVSNAKTLTKLAPLAILTHKGQSVDIESVLPSTNHVAYIQDGAVNVLFSATNSSPTTRLPGSVILLLPPTPSGPLLKLASTLRSKLEKSGVAVESSNLEACDGASFSGRSVISLLEIESPLVSMWEETQFRAFKKLVSGVKHLFWMTHGSVLESWSNGVDFATSQGLFRVLRNEYPMAILPSLDLSAAADLSNEFYSDLLLDVWRNSLREDAEMEYAEGKGLVYVPRATESIGLDYELQLANKTAKPILTPLGASHVSLKASKSGNGKDFMWIPDDQAETPLQADEVEVKVEYINVETDRTFDHASHAVGLISRYGKFVTKFAIGQRVVVFAEDTARTHVRQHQTLVAPLPNYLKAQDAVALVQPLVTAQYTLVEVAGLAYHHSLLLDDAASVTGQALIQVAKATGADVFVLVQSRAERDMIEEKFGIPRAHIFDSALNNFVPLVRQATEDHGVDLIVNQRSGAHVARAMKVLSDFGQFVDIISGSSRAVLPASIGNVTLTRVDMASVIKHRPEVMSKSFQQAFKKYNLQGPTPLLVLPPTNLATMVQSIQTEQVVISLEDSTQVLMPPPTSQKLELDSEATYVLVGGLGALGLNIADWMGDCGARHLVFLSRSGGLKNKDDLQRLADRSIRAEAFQCDVNDATSVARTFDALKANGKRIAGVIQLAMVLRDGIFDNMSFDQWRHAIEPKTKGSRNLLANIPPEDKPFFILLSSITGIIGNTAQANYASGNTFEDALAHYARTHLGINATSIDVGLVSDSSHFTKAGEFGDLASYLSRYQHGWRGLQTNLEELGVVMRAIMRGSTTNGRSAPAQIVLGLGEGIEHNESTGGFSKDKKFELRVVNVATHLADGSAKRDVGSVLADATSMREAAVAVEDHIKEIIAASMGLAMEDIDSQKPLFDYGVDSLQAVEIRNRAQKMMRSDISVFDILSAIPLADVATKIAAKSELVKATLSED